MSVLPSRFATGRGSSRWMDADLHDEFEARLRADVRWLQQLAARLIRDPALADDACQEAWLAADRSGRSDGPGRRSALFRAMRRFAWRWRRAEGRRSHHETTGSKRDELPSTAELLSRGEERQRLWQRLTELSEPYRTTLLLRYQEGLDTKAIAQRAQAPEDTVRRRIRRGIELLRERYDRDGDGPGLGALALVAWPLGNPSIGVATGATATGATSLATPVGTAGGIAVLFGTWMMKKSVGVATIVIAATLVGGIAWQANATPEPAPDNGVTAQPMPARAPITTGGEIEPTARERVAVTAATTKTRGPAEAATGCLVSGTVVDGLGHPFPNASVQLLGGPDHWSSQPTWSRETRTAMDGSFEILSNGLQADDPIRLEVSASPLHVRLKRTFGPDEDHSFGALAIAAVDVGQLRLTAASVLAGRVVDDTGAPIASAWIDAAHGIDFTRSDPQGYFELPHLRSGTHDYTIKAAGFLVHRRTLELNTGAITDLGDVELATAPRVSGIVTDLDGRPLPGAKISTRGFTRGWVFDANPDATFDVPLPEAGPCQVIARAKGFVQSEGTRVIPEQDDVRIALAPRQPRGVFAVFDGATGQPITRFAIRIRKNAGSAAGDNRHEPQPFRQPRMRRFENGRAATGCQVGIDGFEVRAPGYRPGIGDVTAAAFATSGQRIELEQAPGLRGRIVDANGKGVAHLSLRLLFGGLGRVSDAESGKLVDLARDSQLGRMLSAQGGYSLYEMVNLEDPTQSPLPPVVLARFGGLQQHKVYTDDTGRFHFDISTGVGRLVAQSPEGTVLANDHFVFANDSDLQLGDIPLVEPGSLNGRLLPALPVDLSGSTVVLQSDPGQRARIEPDGSFRFDELAPGTHWFRVEVSDRVSAPELLGRSWFLKVAAGQQREIEVQLPVQAACRLRATVLLNGAPAPAATVTFTRDGTRDRAGQIEIKRAGVGTGTVQANVTLRARISIDGVTIGDPTTFVLPSGEFQQTFELSTAALTIGLRDDFQLPTEGTFRLTWQTDVGAAGRPLKLSLHNSDRILGSGTTSDLRLVFPHVPTNASRFTLAVQRGGPYSGASWQEVGVFEQQLTAGDTQTITLR